MLPAGRMDKLNMTEAIFFLTEHEGSLRGSTVRRCDPAIFTRQPGYGVPGLKCPHCGSIIYSRRHRLCGVCDRQLPGEFLFSAQEAERIEALLRAERVRHRRWLSRMTAAS